MKKTKKTILSILVVLLVLLSFNSVGAVEIDSKDAVISVEAFSVGNGFLVEPTIVESGEKLSVAVAKIFENNNINYENYGTIENGFYLSSITSTKDKNIPDCITDKIKDELYPFENDVLGEKTGCDNSGWLVMINNESATVSMSDYTLKDGDVVRIIFSLYFGADVGMAKKMQMDIWMGIDDFYPTANKDDLITAVAKSTDKSSDVYLNAINGLTKLDISQDETNKLLNQLLNSNNNNDTSSDEKNDIVQDVPKTSDNTNSALLLLTLLMSLMIAIVSNKKQINN